MQSLVPSTVMANLLLGADAVSVKQSRELSEILVGFDVANRYRVLDATGVQRAEVLEESSGLMGALSRNILGVWRPMTLHVNDLEGHEAGRLEKPFSFFFHRIDVYEGSALVGYVERRFSLLGRKYAVHAADGEELARLHRPLFKLWQYPVLDAGGSEIARIAKKWGGLLTEVFTDADTYGVRFTDACDGRLRMLLFAALFLVDITNTEDNAGSSGIFSWWD